MRIKIGLMVATILYSGIYSCEKTELNTNGQGNSVNSELSLKKTDLSSKKSQLEVLGEGFGFTEGPAVDKFGNVFFTDQPNNKILRWDWQSGEITTFVDDSGRSNGMFFDKDGYLITCADMHGEIWSIDKDGNHTVLVDNYEGNLLNGPNDLWIAPNGGMYITDPLYVRGFWDLDDPRRLGSQQGGQFLYYLSPDRQSFTRLTEIDQITPNGIIGSPDGKKLYVGHIEPEKIFVWDINPDGSISNKTEFADMRSDGMTVDTHGNIYITNENGVTAFDENGTEIFNVPTGQGWTANVTYGGPNRKTLFITASDKVFGLDMSAKGVKN